MSDSEFVKYNNVIEFLTTWRKYQLKSPILNAKDFRQSMQYDGYIKIDCTNEKTSRLVTCYFLAIGSKYAEQSMHFRKLLAKIADPTDVICITEKPFKVHNTRVINEMKHLRVKVYLHVHFSLIVPRGPHCYPHRVMSHAEINDLLNNQYFCYLVNLPKILVDDPQCIWIGAEVGDVIEIKNMSEISGLNLQHKLVVAKSGKVVTFSKIHAAKEVEEEAPEEDLEDEKAAREDAAISEDEDEDADDEDE
jgi:DNA-directed RNA polymerase subunit H (RpoH/RPB5)